jgi:hypothetical protein
VLRYSRFAPVPSDEDFYSRRWTRPRRGKVKSKYRPVYQGEQAEDYEVVGEETPAQSAGLARVMTPAREELGHEARNSDHDERSAAFAHDHRPAVPGSAVYGDDDEPTDIFGSLVRVAPKDLARRAYQMSRTNGEETITCRFTRRADGSTRVEPLGERAFDD